MGFNSGFKGLITKGTSVVVSANHSVQKSKDRQERDGLESRASSLLEDFLSKGRIEHATEVWPSLEGHSVCTSCARTRKHTHTHTLIDLADRSLLTVAVLVPLIARAQCNDFVPPRPPTPITISHVFT